MIDYATARNMVLQLIADGNISRMDGKALVDYIDMITEKVRNNA